MRTFKSYRKGRNSGRFSRRVSKRRSVFSSRVDRK